MTKEMVSVIMPAFNAGEYIGRSIESVLKQTYKNLELIIIDDHSTDKTKDIVLQYVGKHQKIRYYRFDYNKGVISARQKAIDIARGEYIAFLDADDIWHEDKLKKQIAFMKEKGCAISCTSYEQIDEFGNKLGKIIKCKEKVDYNRVLWDCPIGNLTVLIDIKKNRKTYYTKNGKTRGFCFMAFVIT